MDKQFWDARYSDPAYAYGTEPNLFFAGQLQRLRPGAILMPADGEGRNGVFAATLGWQVTACDLSSAGRDKALVLAATQQVDLNYIVGDLSTLQFEANASDAIGLIYAHFPADQKSRLHRQLDRYLKPGGVIIFEAFSKAHLELRQVNPEVGGPTELAMLFSAAELQADFPNYTIQLLEEIETTLLEGQYHRGKSAIVRFVGIKQ